VAHRSCFLNSGTPIVAENERKTVSIGGIKEVKTEGNKHRDKEEDKEQNTRQREEINKE
jgi:hypothetical protein